MVAKKQKFTNEQCPFKDTTQISVELYHIGQISDNSLTARGQT